jgi:hypothetical protein
MTAHTTATPAARLAANPAAAAAAVASGLPWSAWVFLAGQPTATSAHATEAAARRAATAAADPADRAAVAVALAATPADAPGATGGLWSAGPLAAPGGRRVWVTRAGVL